MKTNLIWAAVLIFLTIGGIFVGLSGVMSANAASSAQLGTDVCPLGDFTAVMDTRPADVIEVELSDVERATVLANYTGHRQPDAVRVFTVRRGARVTAVLAFGRDGCFAFRIFRDPAWMSGVLGRDIVHPDTP